MSPDKFDFTAEFRQAVDLQNRGLDHEPAKVWPIFVCSRGNAEQGAEAVNGQKCFYALALQTRATSLP